MTDVLYAQLVKLLKNANYSLTKPRRLVFEQLLLANEPLSMRELADKLSKEIDRTSVYRTIELFEKLGIVERLQIGWKYKLELSAKFSHHHHHATCMYCGSVTNFEESHDFEAGLLAVSESIGFELHGHVLELRGLCRQCQARSRND